MHKIVFGLFEFLYVVLEYQYFKVSNAMCRFDTVNVTNTNVVSVWTFSGLFLVEQKRKLPIL